MIPLYCDAPAYERFAEERGYYATYVSASSNGDPGQFQRGQQSEEGEDVTALVGRPREEIWLYTGQTSFNRRTPHDGTATASELAKEESARAPSSSLGNEQASSAADPRIAAAARQRLTLLAKKYASRLTDEDAARLELLSIRLDAVAPVITKEMEIALGALEVKHSQLNADLAVLLEELDQL